MMKRFKRLIACGFALVATLTLSMAFADYTLTGNETWSAEDLATKMTGTINLNGHTLTVPELTGNATITDTTRQAYELLESIESTGTQYIRTGVQAAVGTTLELDFGIGADVTWRTGDVIFGLDTWTHGMFTLGIENAFMFYGSTTYAPQQGDKKKATLLKPVAGRDYHVSVGANSVAMRDSKGGSITINPYPIDFATTLVDKELALFGQNTGNASRLSKCIFRRLWIKGGDGTGPGHTFVPVRQLSTGKCGILDLEAYQANPATGFHGNAGTGDFKAGNVTNTLCEADVQTNPGELHVNVAAGTTNENTTVALCGYLKLVKEGAGAFTAQKTGQAYFGGTEVVEGFFQLYNDSTGYTADKRLLGCWGSTVTVVTNGLLNLSGNKGLGAYAFVLDGGTLGNWSFNGADYKIAEIGSLKLLSDSYAEVPLRMSVMSGTVNLNEHTLFVKTYLPGYYGVFTLDGTSTMTNGTFNITTSGGGTFMNQGSLRDLRTVKLVLSCQTAPSADIQVGDIELKYGGSAAGTGKISIYGTYKAGNYHRNCVMQNGSTLDLGGQTEAWPVESTIATCTPMAFAEGATVTVTLGDRPLKSGPIVTWENKPSDTVNFILDPKLNARLLRKPEGLWLQTGLRILIR